MWAWWIFASCGHCGIASNEYVDKNIVPYIDANNTTYISA